MIFFGIFKKRELPPATAPVARERLQVLLAQERTQSTQPNLMAALKDDIVNAIARHVSVKADAVKVRIERRSTASTLRIAVQIPSEIKITKAA